MTKKREGYDSEVDENRTQTSHTDTAKHAHPACAMAAPSFSEVNDWNPTLRELILKYPEVKEKENAFHVQTTRCNFPIDLSSSEEDESVQIGPIHPMFTRGAAEEISRIAFTETIIECCDLDEHDASLARIHSSLTSRRALQSQSNIAMGKRARFTGKGSKHRRNKKRSLTNHRGAGKLSADRRIVCWAPTPWTYQRHLQWSASDDVEDEY